MLPGSSAANGSACRRITNSFPHVYSTYTKILRMHSHRLPYLPNIEGDLKAVWPMSEQILDGRYFVNNVAACDDQA